MENTNTLVNYMNKRFGELGKKDEMKPQNAGPFITISREVGCGGEHLCNLLADELNKHVYCKRWQVISKEVLSHCAEELKIAPQKVHRLFSTGEHYAFDEVISAFTDKYYKSNRVIVKTVREVIRNFAYDGCCIILGRAAHIIAADLDNSLHLRFMAPLEWRIDAISERFKLSRPEALKYIQINEKEKDIYRKHYLKDKNAHEHFDLIIDVSRFTTEQVVRLIVAAFEIKGIPEKMKKVPYF
ncbi:AAA family ATPase [Gaoshiqia sediminis]|uniref:Cytidylate kinase-like family protein n=1 Tax=Gaoshiqia sediminis TaxID=2986998 RepID=A0AA41YD01_9BACT|nr:cytidylate kinase-like family protein [Gaoshiqia sediminis]MCW0484388.1 cytidylate kinase-like family protein [Gaoshiqia sediminis]